MLSKFIISNRVIELNTKLLQLEDEKNKHRQSETSYKELSVNWLKERDDLKKQIADYRSKFDEMDISITIKEKKIKELVS